MNFYIADLHLNHENMITMEKRPFDNIIQENEKIIYNWNEVVGPHDDVWVLGDCFWSNEDMAIQIMRQLRGRKHLIIGNHDRPNNNLSVFWESKDYYKEVPETLNGKQIKVILCHYPIPFFKGQHKGNVMLYGHVHMTREWKMIEESRARMFELGIPNNLFNVGCMLPYMGYTPRTLEQILAGAKYGY